MYQLFYCFYGESADDSEVSADAPVPIADLDRLPALLERVLSDGDFLGVMDAEGNTLQVMYDADDDRYWVEIPSPALGGSHGLHHDRAGMQKVFANLPPRFDVAAFPGFRFEKW